MKTDSLRTIIINRNKGVTSLSDYAERWNFRLDEEDHPHDIENDIVKDAIAHKLNPLTGEPDPEVAEKIFMFFSPARQATNPFADSRD